MKTENRLKFNRKILNDLSLLIEKYPDMRFGQLLVSSKIIDDTRLFYEEPSKTSKKLEKFIEETH